MTMIDTTGVDTDEETRDHAANLVQEVRLGAEIHPHLNEEVDHVRHFETVAQDVFTKPRVGILLDRLQGRDRDRDRDQDHSHHLEDVHQLPQMMIVQQNLQLCSRMQMIWMHNAGKDCGKSLNETPNKRQKKTKPD